MITQRRARILVLRELLAPWRRDRAQQDVATVLAQVREQLPPLIARPHARILGAFSRLADHAPTKDAPATTSTLARRVQMIDRITQRHAGPRSCDPDGSALLPKCDPASETAPQIRGFSVAILRTPSPPIPLRRPAFRGPSQKI